MAHVTSHNKDAEILCDGAAKKREQRNQVEVKKLTEEARKREGDLVAACDKAEESSATMKKERNRTAEMYFSVLAFTQQLTEHVEIKKDKYATFVGKVRKLYDHSRKAHIERPASSASGVDARIADLEDQLKAKVV